MLLGVAIVIYSHCYIFLHSLNIPLSTCSTTIDEHLDLFHFDFIPGSFKQSVI